MTTATTIADSPKIKGGRNTQWDTVVPLYNLSNWQTEAIKKILQLSNLPPDWDSYGSQPPSVKVVNTAIDIIEAIPSQEDLPTPHLAPISGGGIQIEWNISQRDLEIEVIPDGSIRFLKAQNGEPLEEGKIVNSYKLESLTIWLVWG
ncbi:MAG: hypothetical protein HZA19_05150 [Nitrospirae bacterium]|nr:hypothetical protein [Nitrospirota bacterium]